MRRNITHDQSLLTNYSSIVCTIEKAQSYNISFLFVQLLKFVLSKSPFAGAPDRTLSGLTYYLTNTQRHLNIITKLQI